MTMKERKKTVKSMNSTLTDDLDFYEKSMMVQV